MLDALLCHLFIRMFQVAIALVTLWEITPKSLSTDLELEV